ncbi:MAG: CarD family transcriptional regulator, partial [Clostridia bacterium]|nr:CarD family transcriptional regulator [Clostridia bacterium]
MFQAGDTVVHPFAGVCRVLDIRNERFGDRPQLYYVIASTQDKGGNRIYVPVDGGKILLRRPLSK